MHLGDFDKPVLLFGGSYSNLSALMALKKYADQHSIPTHNIICTGDIVAYCGQPYETTKAIHDWGIHVLMGNCEESFATNADDCGCGFNSGTSCDLLSVEWYQFANQKLSNEQRQWFANLPRKLSFNFLENKIEVVHGSVTSINQFLFASSCGTLFEEQAQATNADIIIAGHSGIPFSREIQNKLWHNTGAIGMPANDGTPNTWFSVLSPKSHDRKKLKIENIPLRYDYKQAAKSMQQLGLSDAYTNTLTTGLWPSMDALTSKEKNKKGIAIHPHTVCHG